MEKKWFMVPMEYSPHKKSIMSPMVYGLMFYSPNGIYGFIKEFFFLKR